MSSTVRAGLAVGIAIALAVPAWLSAQRAGAPAPPQPAGARPNIVLIFPDNLGWGEVGVYGSVRGVADAAPRQARRARASG